MTLALFDFDGTITKDDSLLKFIRFVVGDVQFLVGLVVLSPILVAYKLKLIPNYRAKQKMLSWFFQGMKKDDFFEVARKYSLEHIDKILRPKAMEKLAWHQEQNHKIVVVSASIDCWLRPWCEMQGFELIATKLQIKSNIITGHLASKNCYGDEKVARIRSTYNLKEFQYIYAYGDSRGDKEMLLLGDESFYKPFR